MNKINYINKCGCSKLDKFAYFKFGEKDFIFCSTCSLVFRKQFPSENELKLLYKSSYSDRNIKNKMTNQESGSFAIGVYSKFIRDNFLKQNTVQRLLDYGSGTGELVEKLKKYNMDINIDGFEFSKHAIKYCFDKRGFLLKNNLRHVPNNYYDFVTMIEVIEHLTDLNASLKELHRITKPGGIIFITTPNRYGLRAIIERGFWKEARKKFHLFLFDFKSLYYLFKKFGFDDIKLIKYSPIQKKGLISLLWSRMLQFFGLSGTLCVSVKVSK